MKSAQVIPDRNNVINLQERRLDRTVLRTYRTKADIDDIVPNEKQPRMGPKIDEELQRQIEANGGLFEPLLVEPHPDLPGKFRIIDGDRRWTNSQVLVEQGKEDYRQIPIEVTDRTLSEEDRLRVWIYIHRQRKEWDAKEKEMVAYRLVDMMGRSSAANILGITVRELDKLVDVFELSEKFTSLRDPSAAITWSRELMGVSKKLLTPTVIEAVVKKVNQKRITNSKDLRKLRTILPDPVARSQFLSDAGDLESAMLRLGPAPKPVKGGLSGDLEAAVDAMKQIPFSTLQELKGDADILKKIDEAEVLLKSLRGALS
ncbi:MAG: ParB N-terminal domain-containing protein [Alphaproteobacteria bacterium]|jgi:ParB family chromosome partitioning protein|uniref:ParB/RepB/Spo0J family partition protein n=1 Tax=Bradyrhizobium sp. 2TAF24 TaxID=3233011 RepID=UPI002A2BC6B8|nr:ParB N-terminal domain-containing protein [Alphaproteobacteria bacterium]MBL7099926.1 ParB N-terminal domain-containing protein [Alphaproteobacteria bacterium]